MAPSPSGIQKLFASQKPFPTDFIEIRKNQKNGQFLVQNLIFKNWKKKIEKQAVFLVYRYVFG
jgi:hypothetical protein